MKDNKTLTADYYYENTQKTIIIKKLLDENLIDKNWNYEKLCKSLKIDIFEHNPKIIMPFIGIIFEKDTLYHKILVHDDSVNNIRTLILDNNFHSAMDLNNPERIVYEYTKFFHLGLLFVDEPNNVLFIGGGGFSAPKKFFVDYPEMIVNVVEIDQEVVNVDLCKINIPIKFICFFYN